MVNMRSFSGTLLIAAALLYSCSDVQDLADVGKRVETEATDGNVTFILQSNLSSTTRSAEDSNDHTQGTTNEYKVNTARVYLFDSNTKARVKSFSLTNITQAGSDENYNIKYTADKVKVPQGKFDIFVVANTDRVIDKDTEEEFLADIDNGTYYNKACIEASDIARPGIVMSNRASDNLEVTIADKGPGNDNVVTIVLERVLARIDVAKKYNEYPLTDNKGARYATIKLDDYYIVNLAKTYYSFRHTAVLTSLTAPAEWTVPTATNSTYFGRVNDVNGYVIDPYFFNKKVDATGFTNQDKYYEHFYGDMSNPSSVQWTAINPAITPTSTALTANYNTTYCLENCMLQPAQKNGYSTGVVFRATVVPYNNVYKLNAANNLEVVTDPAQYPEVLHYYDYKFFASPEAMQAYIRSTGGSGEFEDLKFEKTDAGYRCYYKYWIRHEDNNRPTEMGVMEFAVVRNNLYRLYVTNVSGLGEGGDGTINVDPDIPDEGEASLQVDLKVKPWIVRDQIDIVL
jgi:hypothetical protein